eukprot:TRINITY_DN27_c0_g1_i1.p1 TRINITY_DN27_c0_g1~~TRINITY_DN27_c0_g1_i1.p1  ORF type:complete len:123 (-),score=0.92 TRINITY_DN27_c0_g1_i1:828-1196(-)
MLGGEFFDFVCMFCVPLVVIELFDWTQVGSVVGEDQCPLGPFLISLVSVDCVSSSLFPLFSLSTWCGFNLFSLGQKFGVGNGDVHHDSDAFHCAEEVYGDESNSVVPFIFSLCAFGVAFSFV